MSRVAGKVAFITGVARGQGRSHALRLAAEGADIIGMDVVRDMETIGYPGATEQDLIETDKAITALGRRSCLVTGDVRIQADIDAAVARGIEEFGHLDIVVANAGICSWTSTLEITEESWAAMLDVDLSGVWRTIKATVPRLIEAGNGGSIVMIGSTAIGMANLAHYSAAKSGVVGLMQTLASEVAAHGVRVNVVHPGTVATDMFLNQEIYDLFRPDLASPSEADVVDIMTGINKMKVPWVQPIDTSNAVLWLASDEARYVTGAMIPVDAGGSLR